MVVFRRYDSKNRVRVPEWVWWCRIGMNRPSIMYMTFISGAPSSMIDEFMQTLQIPSQPRVATPHI